MRVCNRLGSCEALSSHFGRVYGESRWPALKAALEAPTKHIALTSSALKCDRPPYMMDAASLLPALALSPRPGERVLDLCAAPGGKSLVLAAQLFSPPATAGTRSSSTSPPTLPNSSLTCNEKSSPRRARLRKVLQEQLCPSLPIAVTGMDATRARFNVPFDCILVDAPCSSERHLLQQGQQERGKKLKTGALWSVPRIKRDAKLQLHILLAAVRMLDPIRGGRIVYSTCSLAPEENDNVIEKILGKIAKSQDVICGDPLEMVPESGASALGSKYNHTLGHLASHAERTGYGAILLPDKGSSFGPIYWSVLLLRPRPPGLAPSC
jgi:16S rRNA C967 or C1407 C5-methylase (RsmB/RsmF family)